MNQNNNSSYRRNNRNNNYKRRYNQEKQQETIHLAKFKNYKEVERRMNIVVTLIQRYRKHKVIDKKYGTVFVGQNDTKYLQLIKEFNELKRLLNIFMFNVKYNSEDYLKPYKRPMQFQGATIV
jgi:hypothetical protein